MKVPKTWVKLERQKHEDEGLIAFKTPCSPRKATELSRDNPDHREGYGVSYGGGYGDFHYEGGQWWRYFKRRDPDYVRPDRFATLYGMNEPAAVLCRFPQGIAWRKTIVPALNAVGKEYGAIFLPGRRSKFNQLYINGCDLETWEKVKRLPHYQWDTTTNSFKKVD